MKIVNLKISKKVLIIVSTLIVVFIATSIFTISQVQKLSTLQADGAKRADHALQVQATQFMGLRLYQVVAAGAINREVLQTETDWKNIRKVLEEEFTLLQKIVTEPDEIEWLNEATKQKDELISMFEMEMLPILREPEDLMNRILVQEINSRIDEKIIILEKPLSMVVNSIIDKSKNSNAEYNNTSNNIIAALTLIAVLIVLISIIFNVWISRNIQNTINQVIDQTKELIKAAIEGKLTIRANPEETDPEFREITVGINNTLDAVITPLTFAANYISRLSVGDNPPIITDEYKGDFNTLKTNLNNLITVNTAIVINAKKIANGDLTVTVKKRHEKDDLLEALGLMVAKLNETITRISDAAEEIASGSEETSLTSTNIAKGAHEQAGSVEEISASVEQMAASIKQNSENAIDTERIAKEVSKSVIEVNASSQKSLEAIRIIADKIKIINRIAEKTDILAINAAIEAARAGEQGKGFGVVAAEVRKLAELSQKAAIEINNLSTMSLNATEEASAHMNRIIPEIQNTTQLIQEIAATSNEQNSGAVQIAKAVDQFSQVTQQNSASSEELSSSAQELSAQAEMLREIVSFFNTGKETKKTKAHTLIHHDYEQ